jgi:hypothetical protein
MGSRGKYLMRMLWCALAWAGSQAGAQTTYTFVTFTVPNSTYTTPAAINASGQVTGFYGAVGTGAQTGFFRDVSGAVTTISYPGAAYTAARGLNKLGLIAGSYVQANVLGGFFYWKGSYKNVVVNGQPAQLSDVNDHGSYTGRYGAGQSLTGFLSTPGGQVTILQYPGEYDTLPSWVKNNGDVIGTYVDQAGNSHTFVYSAASGYKTLAIPGMARAQITDVNGGGAAVGRYMGHGFVYQNGTFQVVEPPGGSYSSISAINDNGLAVGVYTVSGSTTIGFIAIPGPQRAR